MREEEKAVPQIKVDVIRTRRYVDGKGALILRAFVGFTHDLLTDFGAWNKPVVVWQKDNGLGEDGVCPAHGYQHLQIHPPGKEPMKCHDAMLMAKVKENARF